MLILPFIHNTISNNNFEVNSIKILTIGGQNLWEENNSLHIDNDILNPNDIYRKGHIINDNSLYLCEVDTNLTKIEDFYKWEEINLNDSETFCWKTYYYFTDTNKTSWLEIPDSEKIGKYKIKEIIKKIILKK
jgi:hypothetical protein